MHIKKVIIYLVVILLIVQILFAFSLSLKTWNTKLKILLFQVRGKLPISDKIVIIGIDDTFSALDETGPSPGLSFPS